MLGRAATEESLSPLRKLGAVEQVLLVCVRPRVTWRAPSAGGVRRAAVDCKEVDYALHIGPDRDQFA
jgi:hypothetical protein